MEWAKVGKHIFESSETPIGSIERRAMIQNFAVFIQYHGLRTIDWSDGALADPDRTGIARSGALAALGSEALKLIEEEALQKAEGIKYSNWPAPDSMFWVQWGERFGNYLVVVTNCEGEVKIHMLHTSGEPVYWERYKNKGKMWYVQNRGLGNKGRDRIQDTKCDQAGFVSTMIRRCGDKIVAHLDKEIFNFKEFV